jgi:hypothetical protein
MAQPFNDFVNSVRLADTLEDERFLLKTEQAQIRAYLKKPDASLRPRAVSKLVFLDMVGENTAWGQMEALALMSDDRFSFKRVGYVCASCLLDQTAELTVLVTQTLLHDLKSSDVNIQCLALAYIANNGTSEVCRAVATEIQKLLGDGPPSVMRRAGTAAIRVVQTNPELADSYRNSVQSLLNCSVHGVILSGISMVVNMIRVEPRLTKSWSQFAIPFTKILKTLHSNRPTREFCYGIFNDPYLQIRVMHALGVLGRNSNELEGILQSIISGTDTQRNLGRAILYQAVETIVAVSKNQSLRGLAFNQVGRLLSMREPNVLYSALSSFARVLYSGDATVNRGSVDSMALQRYKSQIVKCLDHQDPSIRRRALDVISALIDETNVESLIPEILTYVKLADAEFRAELVTKIYASAERFAPSKRWLFEIVHQILIDSGNYVSMDMVSSFCELIAKSGELQPFAVEQLNESIATYADNQTLVQVCAFVLGEFAAADDGVTAHLTRILVLPQTKPETKLYIITALAKLAVRFGSVPAVLEVLAASSTDNNLEVQQRSGEFAKLLGQESAYDMFAPISSASEAEDVKSSIQIRTQAAAYKAPENEAGDDLLNALLKGKEQTGQPRTPDLLIDLVTPSRPQQQVVQQPVQQVVQHTVQQVGQQPIRQPVQQPAPPGVELVKKPDFVIYGATRGNPQNPKMLALRLVIVSTGSQLTDFRMQFQVVPGWQLTANAPDGNVIAPGKAISQVLYLLNVTNTPFQITIKITYKYGTQPLSEVASITWLPQP